MAVVVHSKARVAAMTVIVQAVTIGVMIVRQAVVVAEDLTELLGRSGDLGPEVVLVVLVVLVVVIVFIVVVLFPVIVVAVAFINTLFIIVVAVVVVIRRSGHVGRGRLNRS